MIAKKEKKTLKYSFQPHQKRIFSVNTDANKIKDKYDEKYLIFLLCGSSFLIYSKCSSLIIIFAFAIRRGFSQIHYCHIVVAQMFKFSIKIYSFIIILISNKNIELVTRALTRIPFYCIYLESHRNENIWYNVEGTHISQVASQTPYFML